MKQVSKVRQETIHRDKNWEGWNDVGLWSCLPMCFKVLVKELALQERSNFTIYQKSGGLQNSKVSLLLKNKSNQKYSYRSNKLYWQPAGRLEDVQLRFLKATILPERSQEAILENREAYFYTVKCNSQACRHQRESVNSFRGWSSESNFLLTANKDLWWRFLFPCPLGKD